MTSVSALVPRANQYARKAHAGIGFITACGYDRPQIEHLQEVADLVWTSGGSEAEIAAAWLHDSVEDTSVTLEDIRNEFGEEVAKLVHELTDPGEIRHLPTADRKRKQAERVCAKSESAKKIKLADQTSNVRCVTVDPKAEWTLEGRRNYALGAKQIADQCKGICPTLDEAFDREYLKAQYVLGIKEDTTQTLERLDKDC
ncbi:MAG TPA: HD domain-containing protein [Candidatus Paceibacterota bacterium]|nr:HD domain-containing protein [Candidatus Paceibacterota bacterium]